MSEKRTPRPKRTRRGPVEGITDGAIAVPGLLEGTPSTSTVATKTRLKLSAAEVAAVRSAFDSLNIDGENASIQTTLAPSDVPLASTITPEPHMTPTAVNFTPPIQYPLMALPSTVTAYAAYSEHGRNDQSATLTVNATATDGSFTIDWGSIIQGGHLGYDRTMVVKHIPSGRTQTVVFHATKGDIRGQNPTKSVIKSRLATLECQVIAYKESRFCQFGPDSLPLFGPPNGFGIMQLDNSPTPTAQEIWDWTQNVGAGVAKFQSGQATVRQHYKNIQQTHPRLRDLTSHEFRFASYQYYNSGNNGFYWILNVAGNDWVKNPNAAFTSYGDDAMRLEDLVRAGTPPGDWN